jgi:hypothetical protein
MDNVELRFGRDSGISIQGGKSAALEHEIVERVRFDHGYIDER